MTIVLVIIAAACGGLLLFLGVRKRAERDAAAEAQLARARAAAARKAAVPEVSSNLKGVTASQTISPYKPEQKERAA